MSSRALIYVVNVTTLPPWIDVQRSLLYHVDNTVVEDCQVEAVRAFRVKVQEASSFKSLVGDLDGALVDADGVILLRSNKYPGNVSLDPVGYALHSVLRNIEGLLKKVSEVYY